MTTDSRKDKQVELPRTFNAEHGADRLYLNLDDVTVSQLARSIDVLGERVATSITQGFAPLQKDLAAISSAVMTRLPAAASTPITSSTTSATAAGVAPSDTTPTAKDEAASLSRSGGDGAVATPRENNASEVIASAVAQFIGSIVNNLERQPRTTVDDYKYVNPYRGDSLPPRQGDRITHNPEIKSTGVTNP